MINFHLGAVLYIWFLICSLTCVIYVATHVKKKNKRYCITNDQKSFMIILDPNKSLVLFFDICLEFYKLEPRQRMNKYQKLPNITVGKNREAHLDL